MGQAALDGLPRLGFTAAGLLDTVSAWWPRGDRAVLAASFTYGDDARQGLDVWVPADAMEAPLPAIVFFYGGGWNSGDRGDFGFVGRALASQGFVVVLPDYRLAPANRFPAFVEDGAEALRWVQANVAKWGGDPKRIGVGGHSAGAHLAALLAFDQRYGVAGMIGAAALLSGPFDFDPIAYDETRVAMGDWPCREETQPVNFARADAPPTLLATGTGDVVVRARNSQSMARALQAVGAPVEIRLYRGQTHSDLIKSFSPLFRGSNPALEDMVAFLRRALGESARPRWHSD